MKVSIIVPIYNCEKYVRRCLESIAAQDYPDIECILVDDCGTDKSMAIVRDFVNGYRGPVKFKVFSLKTNSGASVARNTGIESASGDYILFVDSDDEIPLDAVSSLAKETERRPGVDMVHGLAKFSPNGINIPGEDLHGFRKCDDLHFCEEEGKAQELLFTYRLPSAPWNKLVRADLIKSEKVFFNPRLRQHQDWLWVYELVSRIRTFSVEHSFTYIYNAEAEGNITNSSSPEKRARMWRIIFEEVLSMGLPRHYAQLGAYRLLGIWFVQRNVVPGLFDDINIEFAAWVRACGLRVPSVLLRLHGHVKKQAMRRVIDGLLYRVCSPHFIQPLV